MCFELRVLQLDQMKYINSAPIAILMATYNGSSCLKEQLDSLYNQTVSDWTLYIRDDCSTDNTIEIIAEYITIYSNIIIIKDGDKNIGAKNNFMRLLECVDSKYYMFSDQDDVWLPNKIEISLVQMHKLEKNNIDQPILVHTDVSLVDSKLCLLAKSFWQESNINPNAMKGYNYLAICSYATGCTTLFNLKAKEVSFPVKEKAFMHDWWVSTQVAKKGIIFSIYDQTVLYRQHENNVFGVLYGKERKSLAKLRHLGSVLRENINYYKILNDLEYGSFLKFLFYKVIILYKTRAFK